MLKGGAGNDVINSGTSQIGDIADGGSGSDFMHCGECTGLIASFIGEAGNDFIQGGKNADLKLDGGEGDDWNSTTRRKPSKPTNLSLGWSIT